MSTSDPLDVDERLEPRVARELIRTILSEGSVSYSEHAKGEMKKDDLTTVDCANVLRAGVVEEPEFENGSWRYRVRTQRIVVVAAFRSNTEVAIVTVWRMKK